MVQEWNVDETTDFQLGSAELASSSGRSEYNDENGRASGDEYDNNMVVDDYASGLNGKSDDLLDGSDYNVEDDEEDEVEDEDGDDDGEGDFDIGRYINGDSDEEENGAGDEEQKMELDEGTGLTSSDYSD